MAMNNQSGVALCVLRGVSGRLQFIRVSICEECFLTLE